MPQVRSDVGAQHAVPGKHAWRRPTHSSRCSRFCVGARHAVPGERPWHRAAYSRQRSSSMVSSEGLVGARYIVPGEHAWHRAAHPRLIPHGTRNAKHTSPLATRKIPLIYSTHVSSKFPCNPMKTKDRVPRKVTHFSGLTPLEFSTFRGPCR
jgi:hypothetical protein